MKIIQRIQAATPVWAASGFVILNSLYGLLVILQTVKAIDILPINQERKDNVKAVVNVLVLVGNYYFMSQKKAEVTTTVTTSKPTSETTTSTNPVP